MNSSLAMLGGGLGLIAITAYLTHSSQNANSSTQEDNAKTGAVILSVLGGLCALYGGTDLVFSPPEPS